MTEWFEKDEFWKNFESFLFTRVRPPSETIKEVNGIIRLLQLKKGEKVLDLASGPGRITIPLARKGFQMTAVDRTPAYLAELGRRAAKKKLNVEIIKKDMSRFIRHEGFGAAISIFSSFGYFSDIRRDQQTLKNVAASLKPGGRFLLDLMGREILKRNFRERTEYREPRGQHIVQLASVKRHWDWVENKWILIQGRRQKAYTFGMRIYSAEEITAALLKAGFSKASLFGNFDGAPYDKKATRLIALATRSHQQ